jgi:transcriptional regulator with XRE-family HTH domain
VHGLSQEELAFRLDSSPRHISRLENCTSRPSETIIKEISTVLGLGDRDSNHLLMSADYAPVVNKIDFYAPELKWLRKAMTLNLRALDPYPTAIHDSSTNILMVNKGWVGFYGYNIPKDILDNVTNDNDFLFNPKGAGNIVRDWEDTLSMILMSLQQKALFSDDPEDYALRDRLASHPSIPKDWQQRAAKLEPMASFRVQIEINGELKRFYSVSSTVGALGATAYSSEPRLTINTLFPEDETINLSSLIEGPLDHPLLFY